ncbi:MAG TPA: NAD(+)/NADH kinase [Patescibacteria group bacterium]|nr:NAD(+)/NADH kinase [Patescibacteria group bacterium]
MKEKNVRAILPPEVARILNYPELAGNPETMKDEMALAITLGGDGTLLNTSRDIAPAGIPVCGVNMGQLGFLTEVELPDLSVAMDRLIAGDYEIEERLMLDTMVIRDGQTIYISPALNDVVVTKGGFSRMIRLKLFVDDELAANYPADGVIISTSTGSTGYSLSSGGPIVNPSLKVILITPICPHTLHARSMVISEEEEIKIRMQATHDDIVLTVDGQTVNNLLPDDIVLVRRSSFRARFIKFPGKSYYEVLRTKLRRGDRDGGS